MSFLLALFTVDFSNSLLAQLHRLQIFEAYAVCFVLDLKKKNKRKIVIRFQAHFVCYEGNLRQQLFSTKNNNGAA